MSHTCSLTVGFMLASFLLYLYLEGAAGGYHCNIALRSYQTPVLGVFLFVPAEFHSGWP